jgi:hypothetical protein
MGQAYQQHPLSAAFPPMQPEELDALTSDIREHGQREAVIVFEGAILDGWHRYIACAKAGVKCVTAEHDGNDPIAFVLSRNLHRRHLTASQRAAAVVSASTWKPTGRPKAEPSSPLSTNAEMAKVAEVTPRTIQHAKAAQRAGLGQDVRDGKISAKAAATKPAPSAGARKPAAPPKEEQLHTEIADLRAKLEEATDEVERLSALEQGEESALIKRLQAELKSTRAARDEAMRQVVELKKQVRMLERKAA